MTKTYTGDGVTITISSPFDALPPSGFAPFQVEIENQRHSPGTWRIAFDSPYYSMGADGTSFKQTVSVPGDSTGIFELLVPVSVRRHQIANMQLVASITGPGCKTGDQNPSYFSSGGSATNRSRFTLFGRELLKPAGIEPLNTLFDEKHSDLNASEITVTGLPLDWRAYSGVSTIFLKDTEWLALNQGQRDAIAEYAAQGGQVVLFTTDSPDQRAPQLQLPQPDGIFGPYGFGAISLKRIPSFPPAAEALRDAMTKYYAPAADETEDRFSRWMMSFLPGSISISAPFILTFVVIFAILIAPVNLFIFARPPRRFRLFWTTPLISLAASGILMAYVLIADGIGGTGWQFVAIQSLPSLNREMIIQEQIARTGLLLSNTWTDTQNCLVTPVSRAPLAEANPGMVKHSGGGSANFLKDDNLMSGDWFHSRSITAQYLEAVLPSRSGLTVLNPSAFASRGQPPQVLSTFPDTLSNVWLIDRMGICWKCSSLEPGRAQTCTAATISDYRKFWRDACYNAGGKLQDALKSAADRAGYFYADGKLPAANTLHTLSGIRWQPANAVYLGNWQAGTESGGTP